MSLPIVLVSGWAMPATVMEPLAEALDGDGRVSVVQLPGLVWERKKYDWKQLLDYLDMHLLETPVILIGWSLGGTLASIYASQNPDKVAGLVTLGCNPCFVRNQDWSEAMLPQTFESFYAGMQEDSAATVDQFSLLCSMGNSNRKEVAKNLQSAVRRDADLESTILLQLLKLLGASDVRSQLADIRCPVVHCFGKDDALVPSDTGKRIEQDYPAHNVLMMEGGHCFFLDHSTGAIRQVADQVNRLCNRS
ncbi:alpha/beta fold hydrolase [Endozoicomonas numazuensis]|uniref:alpha/beta fold hydrolase n=1 Tax=Endozoicomonas numazuensis TaxID=1137799 RepID=UPI00069187B7|nr:alpha/beta fold hydrolase [Endozoicomonas numazuensis]